MMLARGFVSMTALAAVSMIALVASAADHKPMVEWPYYAGDQGADRYSALDDVNLNTVDQLKPAWEWQSPDKAMPEYKVFPGNFTATPLMIDNVVYVITNYYKVVALDAETGQQKWVYDPHAYEAGPSALAGGYRPRGIAAYRDHGKLRLFIGARSKLICIDGETGKLVPGFGGDGILDATEGLSRETDNTGKPIDKTFLEYNAAPVIYKDLVILGTATGDQVYGKDPAGAARAYDVHTGKLRWTFHMIPQPGEFGNDTWLNGSWKSVGSNDIWAGISIDEKRGLVFLPGGNPTNSYYGGMRPGNTLFAQSLIVLDANTGKRKWHYQIVHHDLWDYDLPAQPNLITINKDGKKIDAVAQLTKNGFVFTFDRVTGKPIWPIEERPVPQSDVPGEVSSPTQPFPTKPANIAVGEGVSPDDAFDLTPELKQAAQAEMKKFRTGPQYTPPSLEGTFTRDGGPNWGGGAYDPETHTLYVKSSNLLLIHKLVKSDPEKSSNPFAKINSNVGYEQTRTPGSNFQGGIPLIKPPYGALTAVNMDKGEILWKVPMGKGNDALRKNPALKDVALPDRLGGGGLPGSIVTKGGLVFVGGGEKALYAYDKTTGKEVWNAPLPRTTSGTPMTYRAKSGRQFVLVATGSADDAALVAFALPDPAKAASAK